jgi:hypothetical protein
MDFVTAIATAPLAVEHWEEEARRLLPNAGKPGDFEKWQNAMTLGRTVRKHQALLFGQLGFPCEEHLLRTVPSERLTPAFEELNTTYRESLSSVGSGGLLDATILDFTRHAVRHELGLEKLADIVG